MPNYFPNRPSARKRNEWSKKALIMGAIGGLNAMLWGILLTHFLGLK